MLCQFTEQEFQIVVNFESIGFSSLDDAVEYSACFGTKNGIRADPVLPAYSKWSDGLFGKVIIHRNISVRQKDAEELLLVDAVLETVAGGALSGEFLDLCFCPRKEVVNFRFQDKLTLFLAFFSAEVIPLVVQMEEFRDPPDCLGGDAAIGDPVSNGFNEFCKFPFHVNPAAGDPKPVPSFFEGMVGLIAIGHRDAGEPFEEPFRMLGAPGRLVIIKHNGLSGVAPAGTVYPHIAVGSGFSPVADDLERCFISVDQAVSQQELMEFVIEDGEVQL